MKYLSVCSGIEAATVAWHGLGWTPAAFSEIEPFPSAVLAHHWPEVINLGDLTQHGNWPSLRPDLIVGGTPCQAFSVAGLRKGLEDPRGNLTLIFLSLLARERPRWVVWENVPGALSDKTGAFGAFLGGLGKLGYGFAYRVLDAQFFGVAQRRRRVFVVGYLGDWRRAAAVLFEPHCLSGNPAPSRESGKVAPTIPSRSLGGGGLGTDFDCDGGLIPDVAWCLQERDSKGADSDTNPGHLIPVAVPTSSVIGCLNSSSGNAVPGNSIQDAGAHQLIPMATNTLRSDDFDSSDDGTGRGTPLAFSCKDHGADAGPISPTLRSMSHEESHANGGGQVAVAFEPRCARNGRGIPSKVVPALKAEAGSKGDSAPCVLTFSAVRRLTPTECERLQGFPDCHTAIPWRKKTAEQCPDGPRYKALGNSMAVPVMRWIGERIQSIESMKS